MASQKTKLFNLLKDGEPHRTDEILEIVYGNNRLGLARIGARIYDLKKEIEEQGYTITGRHDVKRSLYWYQMIRKEPKQQEMFVQQFNYF